MPTAQPMAAVLRKNGSSLLAVPRHMPASRFSISCAVCTFRTRMKWTYDRESVGEGEARREKRDRCSCEGSSSHRPHVDAWLMSFGVQNGDLKKRFIYTAVHGAERKKLYSPSSGLHRFALRPAGTDNGKYCGTIIFDTPIRKGYVSLRFNIVQLSQREQLTCSSYKSRHSWRARARARVVLVSAPEEIYNKTIDMVYQM